MKIKRNNENIFPGAKQGLINSYLSSEEFMCKGGRRENETIKLLESSAGSGALLEVKAKSGVGLRTRPSSLARSAWIDLFPMVEREQVHA